MRKILIALAVIGPAPLSACSSTSGNPQFVTAFHDMSDKSFGIQAIAPPSVVRELAICKAVWFAEKKRIEKISLSNPSYGSVGSAGPLPVKVPDDWTVLNTTAYMNGPSPDGNPAFSVAEKAGPCRAWDWY